ncbi:hypothetical protein DPMN_107182 [Dreissena polymorpha]|uniref:BPTI/Kunitz inhibitor domain-containing protein n=2 Tax=Dreissena polymorpha TaxID=45954 RepID=A0A9D4QJP0_DREPO|nr:hypothetical protein DPMN_107182 [Dreissena polymorpha]
MAKYKLITIRVTVLLCFAPFLLGVTSADSSLEIIKHEDAEEGVDKRPGAASSIPDANEHTHEALPLYPKAPTINQLQTVKETRESETVDAVIQEGLQTHVATANYENFLPEEDLDGTIFPDDNGGVVVENVEAHLHPSTAKSVDGIKEQVQENPRESETLNKLSQNALREGIESVIDSMSVEKKEERTNKINEIEHVVELETEKEISGQEYGLILLENERESQIVSPDVQNKQTEVEEEVHAKEEIVLGAIHSERDIKKMTDVDLLNEQNINGTDSEAGKNEEHINKKETLDQTVNEKDHLKTEPELNFDIVMVENEHEGANLLSNYYTGLSDHYLKEHEEIILSESTKNVYKIVNNNEQANEDIGEIVFQEWHPVEHRSGSASDRGVFTDSESHKHVDVEELDVSYIEENDQEQERRQEMDQEHEEAQPEEDMHNKIDGRNIKEHEENGLRIAEEQPEEESAHVQELSVDVEVPGTFEEIQAKPVERANETDVSQYPAEHAVCFLPPKSGFCKAYFVRFFFNTKTAECEKFVYGGCGGNANNFLTLQDCMKACTIVST